MSKFMDSNIENDYGQFVMIQHDNEYDFPEVRYYNGKYNVSQSKLDCDSLRSCNITSKYTKSVNIYRDGIMCLFGCVVLSTFYTINCVYYIYRKA